MTQIVVTGPLRWCNFRSHPSQNGGAAGGAADCPTIPSLVRVWRMRPTRCHRQACAPAQSSSEDGNAHQDQDGKAADKILRHELVSHYGLGMVSDQLNIEFPLFWPI
jgi:hypothetical protein